MSELISVILTTYKREDALEAVLRGLARQTDRAFEIIVADDGSGSATRELVERRAAALDVPLRHVWQEDRGFRAGEARNRAVLASRGAYCSMATAFRGRILVPCTAGLPSRNGS